jgi:hypothetical protein
MQLLLISVLCFISLFFYVVSNWFVFHGIGMYYTIKYGFTGCDFLDHTMGDYNLSPRDATLLKVRHCCVFFVAHFDTLMSLVIACTFFMCCLMQHCCGIAFVQ